MKKIYIRLRLVLLLLNLHSFNIAQNFDWAKSMGGSGAYARSIMVETDPQGNVYSVGVFTGTVDFDPGPGTYSLTSPGVNDVSYISKIDSAGNFLWARKFVMNNGGNFETADLSVDRLGNSYLLCNFNYTMDIDPGPATYTISSTGQSASTCILKLDPAGNFTWVKILGGGNECSGQSIFLDPSQDVYTTGSLSGSNIDFDPDTSSYLLSEVFGTQNYPFNTFFMSKLDSNGKFVFAKVYTAAAISHAQSRITLSNEIISVCVSIAVTGMPLGLSILKHDLSGNVLWAKSIPAQIVDYSFITDRAGNICIAGDFPNTVDFDPGIGTYTLSAQTNSISSQPSDLFILQLDNAGNFNWVEHLMLNVPFASQRIDATAQNIRTDTSGNIYIAGVFKGPVDFDPGLSTDSLNSATGGGFILKLSTAGGFVWVKDLGGLQPAWLSLDNPGSLYVTGGFSGLADADPGPGIYNLNGAGISDAFVSKFSTLRKGTGIGIKSETLKNNLILHPNPTTSIAYLQLSNHLDQATIQLLDLNGRVLQEKKTLTGPSFTVDLSAQSPGLYILQVSDAKSVTWLKLIKE